MTADRLAVENPTIVRFIQEHNLPVWTDQQGKDDAKAQLVQHGGVMVESRYFVGGVLITRAIGTNPRNGMPTFEWTCEGETYSNHLKAIRRALDVVAERAGCPNN